MNDVNIDGAVAIVTGAARGIGAASARALADRGARVIALSIEDDELATTAKEIGADAISADVRDPVHADGVVAHALDKYGRLDLVVANAGIGHAGNFADMSAERIIDLVAVNVRAPMLLARSAVTPMLEQRRGALVFMSSIVGALPVPREAVYGATKAAVDAFADTIREELRGTGVTVSTVCPTVVDTHFFIDRGEPYERAFPRPIRPERIARAVVDAAENGKARYVVPRWMTIPMRIRGVAPMSYRAISRPFS
jgi:short-subunit dehydrogenase